MHMGRMVFMIKSKNILCETGISLSVSNATSLYEYRDVFIHLWVMDRWNTIDGEEQRTILFF